MTFLLLALLVAVVVTSMAGCAKYNTFFNAKRLFDQAENIREEAIRKHEDPPVPSGGQKSDYESAIRKAQKLIDEYPGHGLTDDALFLQAKAYYRLQSYRMSIRKFDLMFTNFPATPFMEEALYIQSLNYLLIGSVLQSQEFLGKLAKQYPGSEFQSRTLKVSGDNAFTLENWEEASGHYLDFLDQFPDSDEWDRVGLKLGECFWELKDYQAAAGILQEVVEKTSSSELGFQAGLLRAQSLVRAGNFDLAVELLDHLGEDAEIYAAEGDVLLTEVEMYIAQGKADDAFTQLENMPETWKTPKVKAMTADLMGPIYLGRDELEDAHLQFKEALMGRTFLEDEFKTRRLSESLGDYLAAENSLSDARPEKVPRLKLLQANAMLFGFDRPGEAARLYREAAVDTAADSTVAARALYGAVKVYKEHLSNPDSAAYFGTLLQERFPDSPQAFEMSNSGGGNLLAFLLDRRSEEQSLRLAALTEDELEDLVQVKEYAPAQQGNMVSDVLRVRRRQVYLARRANIMYPPPELALAAARKARDEELAETGEVGLSSDPSGSLPGPPGTEQGDAAISNARQGLQSGVEGTAADQVQGATPVKTPEELEAEKEAEKKKIEKEKDKKRSWEFDLRNPGPIPDSMPAPEFDS